jgi:excisionase family DNA binding protein
MQIEVQSELLSVPEAAKVLHLKPSTIRAWILKRRVPIVRLGRRVFLKRSECLALIETGVVPAKLAA